MPNARSPARTSRSRTAALQRHLGVLDRMSLDQFIGQLLVGLINGSFYALLALGLSIIFGLIGIVNIAQGAFYMAGAYFSWMLLYVLNVGYWPALILAPL